MNKNYLFLADLASQIKDIPIDSIVSKTLTDNELFKATLFGFAQGQSLSEHKIPHHALLFFVSGEVELTLGEKTMTAQACSWAHMEPDLPHSLTANVPTTMLLITLKKK
ncbi:MAG: cupin domain-containing protein [Anaerolineales bacterium]|jgi:quercetin dioxygenase-like cupin family protein